MRLFLRGTNARWRGLCGTIIRQEISEHSARVALTMGDAARVLDG